MSHVLMSGNEAVARGAWEAGVVVGVGYPGTPSTEVLESLVGFDEVVCEWAPNEKVAAEIAGGASMGGVRTLVTMKHVGLNVAADPLYTQSYTGVSGGLVYMVADDPGMHSSQNEQDTRDHAVGARVPVLEPSDSQEALDYTKSAFELSERFDVPVILRLTTRVSHGKGMVATGERRPAPEASYVRDVRKYVMMPGNARLRQPEVDRREAALVAYGATAPENRVEYRDGSLGVITSGVAYQYVREALPEVSVLKLGLTAPFPEGVVIEFASRVERIAVVEELDRYLTLRVRALGIPVEPVHLPRNGELSQRIIAEAFGASPSPTREPVPGIPPRPPLLCPGCPHRGLFYALGRIHAVVTGDIGCYTLGSLPPLDAMDSCVCMGASIGMAHGMQLAGSVERPVVAVIGDSTFAHSGIAGLLHMAYVRSAGTVVILDNRTTAMTGHQGNPLNGVLIDGQPGGELDLGSLLQALGASSVRFVDPHDIDGTLAVLREETSAPHLSVVVSKAPCVLLSKEHPEPLAVDDEICTACGACIRLGCPAISRDDAGRGVIDAASCVGCGQCAQVCKYGAMVRVGPACDLGGVR